LSISLCSTDEVPDTDSCASTPVSSPRAMAATPHNSAAPMPRRIHSPAPSDFFMALNRRPPTSSAHASEVAAPAA